MKKTLRRKEKEVTEEELKKLLVIVPVEEVYIEALQVKYPIIDWEVFTEESRSYWKIIRVRNHTEVYKVFKDMLKRFDRDDLEKLWDLCSTERGHYIFMAFEKELSTNKALMTVMLANKLQVDESSKMANELLRKIFYQVERPRT
ncbi:hypothetical protein Tco_1000597 [Tanacetum coccineum]